MVKCKCCGYENNDGSQICLNCRERLEPNSKPSSNAENYIYTNEVATSNAKKTVEDTKNNAAIVLIVIIAVIALIMLLVRSNSNKPVIDTRLLGSWQYNGLFHTDVWTFEEDGTYSMIRTGKGIDGDEDNIDNWYYQAEGGVLTVSWSKNVEENGSSAYEYQFGVSDDGRECLVLRRFSSIGDGTVEVLFKVN